MVRVIELHVTVRPTVDVDEQRVMRAFLGAQEKPFDLAMRASKRAPLDARLALPSAPSVVHVGDGDLVRSVPVGDRDSASEREVAPGERDLPRGGRGAERSDLAIDPAALALAVGNDAAAQRHAADAGGASRREQHGQLRSIGRPHRGGRRGDRVARHIDVGRRERPLVPAVCGDDPHAAHRFARILGAEERNPATARIPAGSRCAADPLGEPARSAAVRRDGPDVGEMSFPRAFAGPPEREQIARRRPGRRQAVTGSLRYLLLPAPVDGNDEELHALVQEEADPVGFVVHAIDDARPVSPRRFAALGWFPGRRTPGEREPLAVRRPRRNSGAFLPGRDLPRFATVEPQDVQLRRPGAAGEKGEARPVRRPAGSARQRGIESELARRSPRGSHEPQIRTVLVARPVRFLDDQDDEAPVRRNLDLGNDTKAEEVVDAHAGSPATSTVTLAALLLLVSTLVALLVALLFALLFALLVAVLVPLLVPVLLAFLVAVLVAVRVVGHRCSSFSTNGTGHRITAHLYRSVRSSPADRPA